MGREGQDWVMEVQTGHNSVALRTASGLRGGGLRRLPLSQVYDGLRAGAVPVYWGTRAVSRFVPHNSVIEVQRYNMSNETDVAVLVQEIQRAIADPARYAELQAWRQQYFVPDAMRGITGSSHCRICEAVAHLRNLTTDQLRERRKRRLGKGP